MGDRFQCAVVVSHFCEKFEVGCVLYLKVLAIECSEQILEGINLMGPIQARWGGYTRRLMVKLELACNINANVAELALIEVWQTRCQSIPSLSAAETHSYRKPELWAETVVPFEPSLFAGSRNLRKKAELSFKIAE
jgi:hypothetical protein